MLLYALRKMPAINFPAFCPTNTAATGSRSCFKATKGFIVEYETPRHCNIWLLTSSLLLVNDIVYTITKITETYNAMYTKSGALYFPPELPSIAFVLAIKYLLFSYKYSGNGY